MQMPRYGSTFVDRFLAPWNEHDVDGALALMTDDCVWEVPRGSEPHGTLFAGRAAVRSAIAGAFAGAGGAACEWVGCGGGGGRGFPDPHGTLFAGRAAVRSAIAGAFKAV